MQLSVHPLGGVAVLEREIRKMYAEIASNDGAFGDPVDHGSYNPYDVVRDPNLNPFERTGVSIAILHYLACAIDNGTYTSAVAVEGPLVRAVLCDRLLDGQPLVRSAAEAFLESEARFLVTLRQVFEQLVRPEVHDPDAA